jgi:hypothetical protein
MKLWLYQARSPVSESAANPAVRLAPHPPSQPIGLRELYHHDHGWAR